jgi:hypothetical protein
MIHIGITGTRAPVTRMQAQALKELWTNLRMAATDSIVVHHGKCPFGGADAYAHQLALSLRFNVVMHPMILTSDAQRAAMDYQEQTMIYRGLGPRIQELLPERSETRNREIAAIASGAPFVAETPGGGLYALPLHPEDDARSQRSGTWQTVRFARRYGGVVTIVDTSGAVTLDGPRTEQEHVER